jgi:NAD(P)-dependent dehydrogenase (short-subunit alcohol dehydrogenase family)
MNSGFNINGVLLVTGGGSGIGREIAMAFAAEGARGIHLCDMNSEALLEVANELQKLATNPHFEAVYSVMNVTKPEDCDRAVADTITKWSRLDVSLPIHAQVE